MNIDKMLFFALVLTILTNYNSIAQENKWEAPQYSNSLLNPFRGKVKATQEGKNIYNQMCVLCHGVQGKGNGEAGLSLEPKPADFLALDIKNQTDGAIFWKITVGKAPMSSYEGLLSEEQRWKLVNYIRELEKKE